ncbi:inhibitor of nuclear factor kappa-B kinase subunit beta [Cydia fagiglandana]|uniref:inhibitor of nuclear factor kappa-B kinase subunit beta n=1 Tax=Cydia fagiglandana TaxID=1458189 RepID=UPI002FEDF2ED
MNDLVFIGDWTKDRVLGSGSFGVVVLWRHNRTDEKLAIKTCKWSDELTEKHRERWTKEVEMLQKSDNANIVSTKELPPEFVSGLERMNPSRLPILCMEYCSGGDLRQLLNKAEFCSGLKEVQVRQILSDIRNAMQFLHGNKITHRDLKPENIVMQIIDSPGKQNIGPQAQKKVVYKLIDLGYAKEIDSNSVCASFVGTLQYLAPELFSSKTYSNSVDFWSMGLIAFEVICGIRPFLPYLAPVQWIPHVKKKAHDNISVYETYHGDIEYSNELFPENFISKPFKALLEKWLRIALEWEPRLRGRDTPSKVTFNIPAEQATAGSKIVIFDLLQEILSKNIIKVFSVSTISQHAYEIDDKTNISTLKKYLESDTKVSKENQILISPKSFLELGDDELVVNYWNDSCNNMIYLYDKTIMIKDVIEPVVPKTVQRSLKENQKAMYNFKNSQNLYRNSVYFVMSQVEMYESLVNGLFVRAESFKHGSKLLLLNHNKVDKCIGKLADKLEVVTKMTETGKMHIERLRETGTGVNYLGGFDKIFKDVDDRSEKITKLQLAWNQLSVRLQSATRRSNEVLTTDINNFVSKNNFQPILIDTLKTYLHFKKSEFFTDQRCKEKQCTDIIKLSYECLKLRCKILHEMRHQPFVLKLIDLNTELVKIADIISNAADTTDKLNLDLATAIDELTNCMWNTISLLSSDADDIANLPYSVVSFQKRDFKIGEPVSNHCIQVPKIQDDEKLKSLIEESVKLRKNHSYLTEQLNKHKELMKKSSFDYSFLAE